MATAFFTKITIDPDYVVPFFIGSLVADLVMTILIVILASSEADKKGRNVFGWTVFCFFLGWIGFTILYFLSDCSEKREVFRPSSIFPEEVPPTPAWTCSCGRENPDSLDFCAHCSRPRKRQETSDLPTYEFPNEEWFCRCGMKNVGTARTCKGCMATRRKKL